MAIDMNQQLSEAQYKIRSRMGNQIDITTCELIELETRESLTIVLVAIKMAIAAELLDERTEWL